MITVDAVYQGGVLRPLNQVNLRENERVRITIQPTDPEAMRSWLAEVQQLQEAIVAERGYFPDSAPDIAAARNRDE